jgi:hypothetical protein
VLVYAYDVSLLEENVNIIKCHIEIRLQTSEAVGLKVVIDKTKYISVTQSHSLTVCNK